MPNPQKIEAVKELSEKFSKAKGIYLTDFTHLTVDEAVEFRKRLREKGIEYKVVKNSLIDIAAGEANLTGFPNILSVLPVLRSATKTQRVRRRSYMTFQRNMIR